MKTILTQRLLDAMNLAVQVHGNMTRKGDGSPYIIHPIAVLTLLTKWNANENTCIAGLLHDVLEDVPEEEKDGYRNRIREEFGTDVLEIVEGVTEQDKSLPWKERKKQYLEHLKSASEASAIVSCADLTHNLYSLVAAYREQGEEVWKRFNTTKQWKVWFIDQRAAILRERLAAHYTEELQLNLKELNALLSQPLPDEYLDVPIEIQDESGNLKLITDPLYQELWNHCMLTEQEMEEGVLADERNSIPKKQLIALISTKGKSAQEISKQLLDQFSDHSNIESEVQQKKNAPRYTVMVDDFYHYQDRDYRYEADTFDTLEEAIISCKEITIKSITEQYCEGITSAALANAYATFGLDPYVVSFGVPPSLGVPFSAGKYVTHELCEKIIQQMKDGPLAKQKSKNFFLNTTKMDPEEAVDTLIERLNEMSEE